MATTPTVVASGTQTCVVGTEHTLFQSSAPGVYQLITDLVNEAAGDVIEHRGKRMTLASGTTRVELFQPYYGAQPTDDLIKESIPMGTPLSDTGAVTFSIKQTFGTGRAVPWSVIQF